MEIVDLITVTAADLTIRSVWISCERDKFKRGPMIHIPTQTILRNPVIY